MPMTEEQAKVAFDAATAPEREERARQLAIRELKRRQIMPVRWSLFAITLGVSIGAILYWLVLGQRSIWVVPISTSLSIALVQARWNKRART